METREESDVDGWVGLVAPATSVYTFLVIRFPKMLKYFTKISITADLKALLPFVAHRKDLVAS